MNEMNERRSSAEIVAEWRAELEIHDREAQDGDRTWHFTHYIRADPEMFIRAALRELDRLTAERDAARAENMRLRAACEDTADVIGWYLGDGDGLAALVDKYGSIREVRQVMKDKAAALRAALGIESEASE